MLQPISWAGDVLVPNQGWVIFGGGPKEETTAQKLTSVDGTWEEGPQLFTEGSSDHGLCAVQVAKILRLKIVQPTQNLKHIKISLDEMANGVN